MSQNQTTPRHEEGTISSSPPLGAHNIGLLRRGIIGRSSSDLNVDIITITLTISTTSLLAWSPFPVTSPDRWLPCTRRHSLPSLGLGSCFGYEYSAGLFPSRRTLSVYHTQGTQTILYLTISAATRKSFGVPIDWQIPLTYSC